jgi:hypothetical protein
MNHLIWPEQYDPPPEAAIWVLGEALGACSIAPASGTREQDKEKVYERPQF